MKATSFKPKADVNEYLNCDLNLHIYDWLTEHKDYKGLFEPLEFYNLFYEQIEIVYSNVDKPLAVIEHFRTLKLNEMQYYFLLYFASQELCNTGSLTTDKQIEICYQFFENEREKKAEELFPEFEPKPKYFSFKSNFDFEATKQHLESIEGVKEKLIYLNKMRIEYLQAGEIHPVWVVPFDRKCDLEIENLEAAAKLERTAKSTKPMFKLSKKTGAKIDLIRILNALHGLNLIDLDNGQRPNKQEFMNAFGQLLGVNLSKYHSNLSQALQNQNLEVNLKVFEDMKNITQSEHFTNEN